MTLLKIQSNAAHSDDERLVETALQDADAFAELYRRHFHHVYRYHLAKTGDANLSQDLTAQTFIAALEGLAGYRRQGSFVAWLMGIARRKLALHYRSRRRHFPLEEADALPDPSTSPETLAGNRLDLTRLQDALAQLPPDRAEAIYLCVISELTSAEAAEALGKSQAAVKMLVLRGLRDLRNLLAHHSKEAL